MIEIKSDFRIDSLNIRERTCIVLCLGIYLTLNNACHPINPFGCGVLRQCLTPVSVVVEAAVSVLVQVAE